MANDITAIAGKIIARGLLALREQAVMPRLVNFDWGMEVAQKGDTISVPLPSPETAGDVVPGPIPATPQDQTISTTPIVLDQWKKADFNLTDKQIGEIDMNTNFLPMQASEAIRSLANLVNAGVLANYKGVYGYVGTAGTTPFAIGSGSFANPPTDATNVRKQLNKQLAPPMDRRLVLDPDAEAQALNLPSLANFEQTGDPAVKIEGRLGRKFGFDWYYDNQIPTHTVGSITTGLIAKAATPQAIGLKAIVCTTAASTGAIALKKGDLILFAGDLQVYVVTADATQASAATDVTVNISPGKKVALVGSEAVTLKATANHVVNLGFHRDAFAFATRPVAANVFSGGNLISQLTDPQTGISLALEIRRAFHMTIWEFSILYGTALIRPELAVRLAG
jgi:hypothetical protein